MATFYLVRHAQADYTSNEHRGLSSHGLAAAEALCARLITSDITAIYASPYRRAIQTIIPLAHAHSLPIHLCLALRERRLAQGPVDDFATTAYMSWQHMDFALPGGESNLDAQARGLRVIRLLACETGQIVLSTHGTFLALILNGLDTRYDFAFWQELRMPDAIRLDVCIDHRGELCLTNLERLEW